MASKVMTVMLCLAAVPAVAAEPALSFASTSVAASGVTPQGEVVFWSVAREPQGFHTRVVRHEAIATDANGDGTAGIELPEGVPLQSVWVAVDLGSGRVALGAPAGFELRAIELPGRGPSPGPNGLLTRIEHQREALDLLYVRPGLGAWSQSLGDGSQADADGADDGVLAASIERMSPLGASPAPPEHMAPGDLLVVVDPRTLELAVSRLGGGPSGPGAEPR